MTERMCIATRTVRPVEHLVRFVAGPDGEMVPDILCKLPGRGVWVSANAGALETALRKKLFSRALKSGVRTTSDLVEQVGKLLRRRALELLALAQKAGLVRCGFEKILESAARAPHPLIVQAIEASPDGARKLLQRLRSHTGRDEEITVLRLFSCEELSVALGRANVIHAALTDGNLTDAFAAAARRFESFWDDGTGSSLPPPLTAARMES